MFSTFRNPAVRWAPFRPAIDSFLNGNAGLPEGFSSERKTAGNQSGIAKVRLKLQTKIERDLPGSQRIAAPRPDRRADGAIGSRRADVGSGGGKVGMIKQVSGCDAELQARFLPDLEGFHQREVWYSYRTIFAFDE